MSRPAVLVTGGARRLGKAIARRFGAAGWHVVIHCHRSIAAAEALAAEMPSAEVETCDLAAPGAGADMVERLSVRLADWRVLVNSAAKLKAEDGPLEPELFARMLQVNAAEPMRMAQTFFAHARSAAGRRIIHLTDQKLANPNPDFPAYTMSKHALAATVPILAMEVAPQDRIHALAPGAILPSLDQTVEEADVSHRMNLLGRRTGADEIAEAAWFLATGPLASGQTLFVDSGQHLLSQRRDVIYLAREERREA